MSTAQLHHCSLSKWTTLQNSGTVFQLRVSGHVPKALVAFSFKEFLFPPFAFLLNPVSQLLVPWGKQGSMTQIILLHFLITRKLESDLNCFEQFWTFLEKTLQTLLIQLQSLSANCARSFDCLDWMRLPEFAMSWCPWKRRLLKQASHVLGEVSSQQWRVCVFVCVAGYQLADWK